MAIRTPRCGVGRGIALLPEQAFGVKLRRKLPFPPVIRQLRQDRFVVTVNSASIGELHRLGMRITRGGAEEMILRYVD
jgi:hypothetical protein